MIRNLKNELIEAQNELKKLESQIQQKKLEISELECELFEEEYETYMFENICCDCSKKSECFNEDCEATVNLCKDNMESFKVQYQEAIAISEYERIYDI